MKKIRSGDQVVLISGDEKGRQGKVLRVLPGGEKVVVQGLNMMWKHLRKTQKHPQGGRLQKEAPLNVSKVMLLNPSTGKPERVGIKKTDAGSIRFFKKSKNEVGKAE